MSGGGYYPKKTDVQTIEVHEHRAPTDESMRLVTEMEEKIRAKIIAQMPVVSHPFKGGVTHYHEGFGSVLVVSFTIGADRHDIKIELPHAEMLSSEDYAKHMVAQASLAIAEKLLPESRDVLEELQRRWKSERS